MISVWYINRDVTGALAWLLSMLFLSASSTAFWLCSFAIEHSFAMESSYAIESTYASSELLANELLFTGYLLLLFGCGQFLGYARPVACLCIALFAVCSPLILGFHHLQNGTSQSQSAHLLVVVIIPSLMIFGYRRTAAEQRCFVGTAVLCMTLFTVLLQLLWQPNLVSGNGVDHVLLNHVFPQAVSPSFSPIFPVLLTLSVCLLCNEKKYNQWHQTLRDNQSQLALSSHYLGTMSHELRTPLNGIMGTAQLTLASSREEQTLRDTQTILQSAQLLIELVDNVLDYSRLDLQDVPLEESDVNLRQHLEEVVQLLQPLAQQKSLVLRLWISDAVAHFYYTDHKKLRQILLNLLGNAIKFTDRGRIDVEVTLNKRTALRDIATDHLLFQVKDTGIGIPEQAQERLLQPFYQVNPADKNGSGLGLAICQKLLQSLNSKLYFSSQIAVGSSFYFELPLIEGEEELIAQNHRREEALTGLSVLLVEDLPLNQQIAISLLNLDKHQVTLATDLTQAQDLCKTQAFDIILSDISLPDGRGTELAASIQSTVNRYTPIAAMTARVAPQDAEQYRQKGMQYLIAKPIKLSQLRAVLALSQKQVVENKGSLATDTKLQSQLVFNKAILGDLSRHIPKQQYQDLQHKLPAQLEQHFARIQRCADGDDVYSLHKALHRGAGTAAQLGFEVLTTELTQLEQEYDIEVLKANLNKLMAVKQQSIELFGREHGV